MGKAVAERLSGRLLAGVQQVGGWVGGWVDSLFLWLSNALLESMGGWVDG